MKIEVFWDNLKILEIEKVDDIFITNAITENLIEAKDNGFPLFFLKNITVVSNDLAAIVKQRLSSVNYAKDKIKFKDSCSKSCVEDGICEYINETGCRRPTDKFSLKIDLN